MRIQAIQSRRVRSVRRRTQRRSNSPELLETRALLSSVTVLSHGASISGSGGPLTAMGTSLMNYFDSGTSGVFQYTPADGELTLTAGTASPENTIVVFDWETESDILAPGFDEGAGDAMFAMLAEHDLLGSDYLHLIGHSRGAIVVSEAAQRVLHYGHDLDHLTFLDHENGAGVSTQLGAAGEPMAWDGVTFVDNYHGTGTAGLQGEDIPGAHNVMLDEDHSGVRTWYRQTIDALADDDESNDPTEGFHWRHMPGDQGSATVDGPRASFVAPPDVVNGNFDYGSGTNPLNDDFAGWGYHGGGGDGDNSDGALNLSFAETTKTHNRMFFPENAGCLKFDLFVENQSTNDELIVTIGDTQVGTFDLAPADESAPEERFTAFETVSLEIPTELRDMVDTMTFQISAPGALNVVDSTVEIDEINFASSCQLDLVFVIDATGSMSDDIDAVKESASDIVDRIFEESDETRVGIVLYRDQGDAFVSTTQLGFSEDEASILSAIDAISVTGGGDIPEAVYSGLVHGIDGFAGLGHWRGEGTAKKMILMGDAPPKNPEPVTGYTHEFVAERAAAGGIEIGDGASESPGLVAAADGEEPRVPVDIFTIGIGFNSAALTEFERIAEDNRGAFFPAETADDVVDAILDVIDSIDDGGTGSGSVVEFSAAEFMIAEADAGTTLIVELTRTGDTDAAADVIVTPTDGTATAMDYDSTPVTATFAAGETTTAIAIPIVSDFIPENDETINLTLSAGMNSTIGDQGTSVLTILDDDCDDLFMLYPEGEAGGNVRATVVGGHLRLRGNHDDNAISVYTDPAGRLIVQGLGGTTVNGSVDAWEAFADAQDHKSIAAAMRQGLDFVCINGVSIDRWLSVNTGDGAGAVSITDSHIGGFVSVNTDRGDSWVGLNRVAIDGPTNVYTGRGHDTINIADSALNGHVRVASGKGHDAVTIDGSHLSGRTRINTGRGNDEFHAIDSVFEKHMNLLTGGGDDHVGVFGSGLSSVSAFGLRGTNLFEVERSSFAGRVIARTAIGTLNVEIGEDVEFGDRVVLRGGVRDGDRLDYDVGTTFDSDPIIKRFEVITESMSVE